MADAADFPLNAWYAAGWRGDIGRSLLARTVCGVPVVLFRTEGGAVTALEDACPHRLAPLSLGQLDGDRLVCGYHGMSFAPSGECLSMPGVDKVIPSKANCARTFPVIERHNLVWIWPGAPAKAEPATVPDLHWADDPNWACKPGYLKLDCDYRLVLDNLMDLTHEAYVHSTSIGHKAIVDAPFEVTAEDGRVQLKRVMIDGEAPPFLAMQLKTARGLGPGHIDRWQIIQFRAPSTIVIDVGVAPTGAGAPEGDYSKGVNTQVINAVTPGKPGETHYFFTLARDFLIEDAALTERMGARNVEVFKEDQAVLEAQQARMTLMPERKLRNFGIDLGGLRARQAIARMVAEEQSETAVA